MPPMSVEEENQQMDFAIQPEDQHAYELARMRHSCAHLMAESVLEFFPDAKFGIGPAIENGFYYDFDLPRALTPDDLVEIESRMRDHQAAAEVIRAQGHSRDEALEIFGDNPYKVELIQGFPEDEIITTLPAGRVPRSLPRTARADTGEIGPFKLLSVAGAYWRGDEKRPMLQRIYGTAWPTQEELDAYLHRLEEAQRRDHRRLGRELDLFSVNEEIGPGLILWHPEGGHDPLPRRAVRAERTARARLRPRLHAAHRVGEDLPDVRAPRNIPREHVLARCPSRRSITTSNR